jgi:hypothetical protein
MAVGKRKKTMLLDVLIILLVVAGVGFGFWKGILLPGLVIVGIYLGALLARFIYQPLASSFVALLPININLAQILVFLLVIAAVPLLAVMSPNPTVANTVTVKYSASVWVSGWPKFAAELLAMTT